MLALNGRIRQEEGTNGTGAANPKRYRNGQNFGNRSKFMLHTPKKRGNPGHQNWPALRNPPKSPGEASLGGAGCCQIGG